MVKIVNFTNVYFNTIENWGKILKVNFADVLSVQTLW